ncbi:histone deacetylase family protein [Mesorhizobium sp.]|uniref:histone deacetylase family protein n=1 Tax=Mesorhizobium sp. TaxID=1871066 RepID=UPI000FE90275|nr:histone deacetylase family protein [Mesorhizobium sp.]RWI22174.1 MAG: histone deacetylase family protein [Mesorhizobium sp.]RWK48622.1 MAG: histone deacetylase family protein [Mesorhizobium sp.]RWK95070.1 MAG: histone deacetylase family protein [Mesorhizobium sp.]TIQ21886.1 MAG: histone deacetylase family protein [Mesorhizobium sp.]TIQ30562.1 MAG: histone deacetylase family protein [Mesorhizobium sp.]
MKTVFSPLHAGHAGNFELISGAIVPAFDKPSRAEFIKASVESEKLGPVLPPDTHDLAAARQVHTSDYIDFLPTVWPLWEASGRTGSALPFTWPTRGLRGDVRPQTIDALLGFYSFDGGAGFVKGTWEAIKSSYDVALTAAALVKDGEISAFALCRPPGHHAGAAFMGGYCYINNAAVAAQWLRDQGARRVSILDVDYHHGNGTQDIFYSRGDVQVLNLHGDPMTEYPFFLGHADERGAGPGEGFNVNYPMPFGTAWDAWNASLEDACAKLVAYAPEVVVVSLGVDTFEKDPISKFKLKTADYPRIGRRIAKLGLPTLFVMEGGYAVEEIGINAVGVLTGFEDR